jgi:hypothetical protein
MAVAGRLNVTPQPLSNYKKKGRAVRRALCLSSPLYADYPSTGYFSLLTPDEMVCVGKLLMLLRAYNAPAAATARSTIDTLLKIAISPAER